MTRNPTKEVLEVTGVRNGSYIICVSECFKKWLSNFLKKRNLTTIPLIPILKYGESNATLASFADVL